MPNVKGGASGYTGVDAEDGDMVDDVSGVYDSGSVGDVSGDGGVINDGRRDCGEYDSVGENGDRARCRCGIAHCLAMTTALLWSGWLQREFWRISAVWMSVSGELLGGGGGWEWNGQQQELGWLQHGPQHHQYGMLGK